MQCESIARGIGALVELSYDDDDGGGSKWMSRFTTVVYLCHCQYRPTASGKVIDLEIILLIQGGYRATAVANWYFLTQEYCSIVLLLSIAQISLLKVA